MEFNITVNGDKIKIDKPVKVAHTGNVNTYRCNFAFSDEWSGLSSFLVSFIGGVYYTTPIVNNSCILPKEVCMRPGYAALGVFGTNGSETDFRRISTGLKTFYIEEGAYRNGDSTPQEPQPELWETLVNKNIPKIGENGNWYVYNIQKGEYIDSGSSSKGADGNTPQKGTDYWTEEDKAEIFEGAAEAFESEIANKVDKEDGKGLCNAKTVDVDDDATLWITYYDSDKQTMVHICTFEYAWNNLVQKTEFESELTRVEKIAKGCSTGYVFDTEEAMYAWLNETGTPLELGDHLYIRDTEAPDYWWDDTTNTPIPLDANKVFLVDYATKAELETQIGDIETALDSIIAIQNSLIGGDSE